MAWLIDQTGSELHPFVIPGLALAPRSPTYQTCEWASAADGLRE